MNIVFKDAMEHKYAGQDLQKCIDLVGKVAGIVRFVRASSKYACLFKNKQEEIIGAMQVDKRPHSPHVLFLAAITRWGSTFDMVSWFLGPVVVKALEEVSEEF